MSDIAIRVENLSKQYRIGTRERNHTLRDTLTNAFLSPFRLLRSTGDGRRETEGAQPIPGPQSPVHTATSGR